MTYPVPRTRYLVPGTWYWLMANGYWLRSRGAPENHKFCLPRQTRYIGGSVRRSHYAIDTPHRRQGAVMKYAICCWMLVVASAMLAVADETTGTLQLSQSPLVGDGQLLKLKPTLAPIFQFKLEAGQLILDRDAWKRA